MTESPLSPSSPVIKATAPPYPVKLGLAPDESWSEIDETAGPSRKRRCACRGKALASVSAATSKTVLGMHDWYTRRESGGRDRRHGLAPGGRHFTSHPTSSPATFIRTSHPQNAALCKRRTLSNHTPPPMVESAIVGDRRTMPNSNPASGPPPCTHSPLLNRP